MAGEQRLAPVLAGDGVNPLALGFLKLRPSTILPLQCVVLALDATQVNSAIEHLTSYILLSRRKEVHFFPLGKVQISLRTAHITEAAERQRSHIPGSSRNWISLRVTQVSVTSQRNYLS